MRPAFTLMEVMVAVLIISVTLGSMLEITRNAGFIYERGEKRLYIQPRASLAFANPLQEHPFESIDLKSVAESFGADDDEILDLLRDVDPKVASELFSQIDLSQVDDEEGYFEEEDIENETQSHALGIDIYRLTYREKDGGSVMIYRLKLMDGN